MKIDQKKFPMLSQVLSKEWGGQFSEEEGLIEEANLKAEMIKALGLAQSALLEIIGTQAQTDLTQAAHYAIIEVLKKVDATTASVRATYRDGRLSCDMKADCKEPVTHIDNKGFVYCTQHGDQRSGSVPCRKLKPEELKQLESGKPVAKY